MTSPCPPLDITGITQYLPSLPQPLCTPQRSPSGPYSMARQKSISSEHRLAPRPRDPKAGPKPAKAEHRAGPQAVHQAEQRIAQKADLLADQPAEQQTGQPAGKLAGQERSRQKMLLWWEAMRQVILSQSPWSLADQCRPSPVMCRLRESKPPLPPAISHSDPIPVAILNGQSLWTTSVTRA